MAIFLSVKIIPKAAKSAIVGWENERLKIRIKALPEKGNANEELIRFLADFLEIAKSNLEIVSGKSSRNKRIKISQMTEIELINKITKFLEKS